MKFLFWFFLFLFGAFAMNIDNLFFEFVSGVWYGIAFFNLIIYIMMLPKTAIQKFVVLAILKGRPLPINLLLASVLVKWALAFLFGHVFIAPVMLFFEFLCYFRIKINLPKKLTKAKI